MVNIHEILLLLLIHTISDFCSQTRKMAENKSQSIKWLSIHVFIYILPFLVFGWKFTLVNFILHWIIDFISSRASGYYYKQKNFYAFFNVIGFDQYLHIVSLVFTYYYMVVK